MKSQTVLITGANKGIGFEIARQLGKKGFHVILSGRDESRLADALEKLKVENRSVESLLMDVSDESSVSQAAAQFAQTGRKLDVLINNAAILRRDDTSLLQNNPGVLVDTLNTNCHGPLWVIRSFLPFLNTPARIINMSSSGGSMTDPVGGWAPAYCTSKTLLNSMTRQLAYELERKRIVVNVVDPGWVKTEMGGKSAPRPVEKGAETPVWLATEAPLEWTGKFFRDKKVISW